jgi:cellulose synthase/poly-beta-1,6-N-acetylglucosamine synthase-like glycosyltransferase
MVFLPGQPFSTIGPFEIFNLAILVLFTLCFAYQIVYVFVSLLKKSPDTTAKADHRYAALICARNESEVICDIIQSIRMQNYPAELIDIFVVADNCADNTAEVAQKAGATVFVRNDAQFIGKGYALKHGFASIEAQCGIDAYEAYFIFDADNVLDENYFKEMNKAFDRGALACTSYRNAKNFSSNWISAGYGIWFLREARYINQARYLLNTSCAVSGTGFFVSAELIKRNGGWKYHLLTEDIEFSVDTIINKVRISFAPDAVIYDEQPLRFRDSWNQRLRWSRGMYQVFAHYGAKLFLGEFANPRGYRFACYDLLMTIAPAMLLMTTSLVVNLSVAVCGLLGVAVAAPLVGTALWSLLLSFFYFGTFMYVFGIITTITERRKIRGTRAQKIGYTFTFPLFVLTYIPIAITALFKTPKWKPTHHSISVDVEEFGHYLSGEYERP